SLHAFVSGPKDYSSEGAQALRAMLSKDLPPPLVPVRIAVLPSLPLTARGKIDRDLLLKRVPRRSGTATRPPADNIERALFDIWRRTLHRKDFGAEDNLQDLGASSLQIFEVFSCLDGLGWNLAP